jgi:hypothetical protein
VESVAPCRVILCHQQDGQLPRSPVTFSNSRVAVSMYVTPCDPVQLQRRFGEIYCLRRSVRRIAEATKQATYSLTLKKERVFSSETSVSFYQTTQRKIPQNGTLYSQYIRRCVSGKYLLVKTVMNQEILIRHLEFFGFLSYTD